MKYWSVCETIEQWQVTNYILWNNETSLQTPEVGNREKSRIDINNNKLGLRCGLKLGFKVEVEICLRFTIESKVAVWSLKQ